MKQVKIGGTLIDVVACYGSHRNMLGINRDSLEIILQSDYETVVNTFTDGITYSLVETEDVTDINDEGIIEIITDTHEWDKSEYCLSGDVVDHRDGTISVFMGKKTAEELAIEQAEEASQLLYDVMFGE